MLRKKKILTAALCAGGVVLSAALTAAETETTIVSQPFAAVTGDLTQLGGDKPGTWEGYGSVTNQTVGYAKPAGVGSPINDATDKLYLSVDGSVICTAATEENKPATVDMMIQISRPDEALALPTGETTSDPKGASAAIGSWYKLNTATVQKLSSLKVVGSTAIDEVVVKYGEGLGDVQPPLADIGGSTASGVPYQWIAEQGITRAMAEGDAPEGTGMKVVEKYQAGFDVADGQKLEIKKMTMTTGGAQLVVPVAQARDGFKNVIEVNKGATVEAERVDIPVGEGTVTVPVPAPNGNTAAKYTYQIKTQTK